MKVAFAHWENRIAPVFDIARQIRMLEVADGLIVSESEEHLTEDLPVQKALRLAELEIGTLVCGAISRSLYELICAYEIHVMPFIAGELNAVIEAWLRGDLDRDIYAMPGCCRHGRNRYRTMNQSGQTNKENVFMNPGSMGRGGGGGMGRGGGGGMGRGGGGGMGRGGGGGKTGGQGRGQGGMGSGRKGGPLAGGPNGFCICPECGQREPHKRGEPCQGMKCPKCGAMMQREGL